jgi:L-ascorbate metabolism protein UlaG (beta-lactamase superfamily)
MLTDVHFAAIGRLDVLMVPIDGGLTLSHGRMAEIAQRLRSSLILPMHRRGSAIQTFIRQLGQGFAAEFSDSDTVTISARDLPSQPTILFLRGI